MLPVVSVIVVFTQPLRSCVLHCLSVEYHFCMGGHSFTTHMHVHGGVGVITSMTGT